jgi:hypothetical protein
LSAAGACVFAGWMLENEPTGSSTESSKTSRFV